MKHTKEEIVKALTIIQDVCVAISDCINCPFGDCVGVCKILNDTPDDWEITEHEEVWRAFE